MRLRVFLVVSAFFGLALGVSYVFGDDAIFIGGDQRYSFANLFWSVPEIIAIVFATLALVYIFPTLTPWEMRRFRPRARALLLGLLVVIYANIVGGMAVPRLRAYYDEPPYPQYELVFNNVSLFVGLMLILLTFLGRTKGVVATLLLYALANIHLARYGTKGQLFPFFSTYYDVGPWFQPANIAVTAIVVCVGLWCRYHYAGASNSALQKDV